MANNKTIFIFGGFILTGGTFTDKTTNKQVPWKGITLLVSEVVDGQMPVKAEAMKAWYSDSLVDHLRHIAPGSVVKLDFSMNYGQVRICDVNIDTDYKK